MAWLTSRCQDGKSEALPMALLMNSRPHQKPVSLQKRKGLKPQRPCQGWDLAELIKVDSTRYLKYPLMDPPPLHLQQGIESIDQIASLCQSDLEAVRTAAREATLSFGKVQHQTPGAVGCPRTSGRLCQRGHGQPSKTQNSTRAGGTVSDPLNCIWPRRVSFIVEVARSALFPS